MISDKRSVIDDDDIFNQPHVDVFNPSNDEDDEMLLSDKETKKRLE